jgi:hypothetical protein
MKIADGLSRLFTIYGTALVLMFFSEYFFLNEGPVQDVMKIMSVAEDASILGYVEFTLLLHSFRSMVAVAHFLFQDSQLLGALLGWWLLWYRNRRCRNSAYLHGESHVACIVVARACGCDFGLVCRAACTN